MDAHDRMFGEIAVRLELLSREQLTACRKAQADGAGQRSLAQLALSLGLMSEAEINLVTQQQRKVIERRREARDAGGVTQPDRPPRARTESSERTVKASSNPPGARESRPHAKFETRPGRLRGTPPPVPPEARASSAPPDPLAAPSIPPLPATAAEARAAADRAANDEREPTIPRVPNEPRSLIGMGLVVPDLDPSQHLAPATMPSPPPEHRVKDERPGKRTEVPPARARRLANTPPANTNQAAAGLSRAAGGGTLLASSGQLQRAAQLDLLRAPALSPSSVRPAADRGWRNPSKPPPQAAAQAHDASVLAPGPRTGTLAWNPNPALAARPIAAPGSTAPTQSRYLDQLLALAIDTGASDLHAHSGSPVLARVDGALWPLTADAPLSPPAAEQVIAEIMTDAQWDALQLAGEVRFAYELAGVGRFRAHAYRQEHGLDIVFRALPSHIADPKDLQLPSRMLLHLLECRSGLFLVSGPPGSGKTTTLATLAHVLANEHNMYVATAEAPIEIVHGPGLGLIEQREIPTHAHNFAECIEQAMRQSADVIVVSELSSATAVAAALHAALAGCAVIASVQADSPWAALSQLLGYFTGLERAHARARLALAVRGVFTMHLVPRFSTRGSVPAVEMLLANPQLAQLIADEQLDQLEPLMAASNAAGMQTLEAALYELSRARSIAPEIAQRAARRERLEASGT